MAVEVCGANFASTVEAQKWRVTLVTTIRDASH
jgi:hypothetical protein